MFELKIPREKWLRGEGSQLSFLRRESDGKQCCVGLYLSALGVKDEFLNGRTTVQTDSDFGAGRFHSDYVPQHAAWLAKGGEDVCNLYVTNDERADDERRREAKITELFAEYDVSVTFTGALCACAYCVCKNVPADLSGFCERCQSGPNGEAPKCVDVEAFNDRYADTGIMIETLILWKGDCQHECYVLRNEEGPFEAYWEVRDAMNAVKGIVEDWA